MSVVKGVHKISESNVFLLSASTPPVVSLLCFKKGSESVYLYTFTITSNAICICMY